VFKLALHFVGLGSPFGEQVEVSFKFFRSLLKFYAFYLARLSPCRGSDLTFFWDKRFPKKMSNHYLIGSLP